MSQPVGGETWSRDQDGTEWTIYELMGKGHHKDSFQDIYL